MDGNEGGVYPCYVSKTRGPCRKDRLLVHLPPWLFNLASTTAKGRAKPFLEPNSLLPLCPQGGYAQEIHRSCHSSPNGSCVPAIVLVLRSPRPTQFVASSTPAMAWEPVSAQPSASSPCCSNAVGELVSSSTTTVPCPLGSSCNS